MQTKTLIQATANVIKITELNKGNVIKLVDRTYSSPEMKYGVVLDVLNSGSETYIQLLLYKQSYGDLTGEIKMFNGSDDIALFPASVDEVREELASSLKGIEDKIQKKEDELVKEKDAYAKAKDFVNGETAKQLTEASFETLTTEEWKVKEIEKQAQIKALEQA